LTILAPTDEAVSEVPNLGALLEDKAALTAVLQRHIVAAKVLSGDVTTGPVKTIGGETISAKVEDSKVSVRLLLQNVHRACK
jgi:uncharacterized surface protein with fasciclin (FAS1) repeats